MKLSRIMLKEISQCLTSGSVAWALATLNEYEVDKSLRQILIKRAIRAKGDNIFAKPELQPLCEGKRLSDLSRKQSLALSSNLKRTILASGKERFTPSRRVFENLVQRSELRSTYRITGGRRQLSSIPVSRLSSRALS